MERCTKTKQKNSEINSVPRKKPRKKKSNSRYVQLSHRRKRRMRVFVCNLINVEKWNPCILRTSVRGMSRGGSFFHRKYEHVQG